VTYGSIARQRLGKHIPAGAKARNNTTSITTQRINKHASSSIEAVFSGWPVQSVQQHRVKFGISFRQKLRELSRNGSSSGDGILRRQMARKEFDCDKKTCVIRIFSGTVINPLPGYD
jgi:hypothetical protein